MFKRKTLLYPFSMLFCSLIVLISPFIFPQSNSLKFKHLTSNDGLSQNFISTIYQDKNGFMWFGTKDGLNRYDGYEFKVYRHNPYDTTSLSGNFISAIFEDSKGNLWIGSTSLDLFDPEKDSFRRIEIKLTDSDASNASNVNRINSIIEDKNGLLWIGTNYALISYNPLNQSSNIYYQNQDNNTSLSDNMVLSLSAYDTLIIIGTQNGLKLLNINSINNKRYEFIDIRLESSNELMTSKRSILSQFRASQDILYCGTPAGLVKVNLYSRESEFISYEGHKFFPIWHNRILSMVQDKNGNLWLASSGGLVIYNPILKSFTYHFHNPKDDHSLSLNSLTSLFSDRGGKIWLGTAGKGINLFDQNRKAFLLYNGLVDKEPFKTSFSVSAILSDKNNNLWTSTQHKLFRINRETGKYIRVELLHGPEGEITSILEDDKQNIWVASSGGLHKISEQGIITRYSHDPLNPGSLKTNFVQLLFINSKGDLFVLNSKYLSRLNKSTGSFTHFELNFINEEVLISPIKSIYESRDGSLWLGWSEGLVKYNIETQERIIYTHRVDDDKTISSNEVLSICEDPLQPEKFLWIGTHGGGLSRLNLDDNTFSNFSDADGLPNNVVYGILSSGNELWLSTNNGLCKVTTDKYGTPAFRNYDITDGLQGNEFNTGAYFKSHTGELFFGGLNGLNAFFPSSIIDNIYVPPIVITELKFLQSNFISEKETHPQITNINTQSEITIPYSFNSFTIQFASLDFTAPEKNLYMYKLKPIHDEWIFLGTQRDVTFTELGTGEYELIVKGSNNDGIWNEEGALLNIIINPPFWQTFWAYAVYVFLFLFLLYGLRRYELNRIRLKNRLKQESFETQKLKELDAMKSGFFANISHEFRTPLTLILGPAEQLEQDENDIARKEKLKTIKSSASRLLRLINQILDLSKLEKGKIKLNCEQGDLVNFVKGITMSFSSIAEKKSITLSFESESPVIQSYFDKDIFEKIFYNLLSNAFKFTPKGGKVIVKIMCPTSTSADLSSNKNCKISVIDSGIGIPEKEINRVFNKFYSVENINGFTEQGSGIGLALVKDLVELHKGNITVESKINQGSAFTVSIPLGKDFLLKDEMVDTKVVDRLNADVRMLEFYDEEQIPPEIENSKVYYNSMDDQLIALIVEDNPDLRKFISINLKPDYNIIEASNGNEGCKKATELIPDIIISDVMMPEMDGFSLCKKLKRDERTSHIPIILLTARAGEEDKLNGLETGADDFLTKPFSSKELSLRVRNLIETRQNLRKKFSGSLVIKPKEITTGSVDKHFLEKAIKVIENNIDNDKFSVEEFSSEMNLSHSQLHRKLKALINQSAIQFIRSIRMQRALELLQKNTGTIAEIAWKVGFVDPSYFTKIFSKHFGYLPSDVNKSIP